MVFTQSISENVMVDLEEGEGMSRIFVSQLNLYYQYVTFGYGSSLSRTVFGRGSEGERSWSHHRHN